MLRPAVLALTVTAAFACSWDYVIWTPRGKSADPLYRFVRGEKAGFIDREGRIVLPPTFETYGNSGPSFHDGRMALDVFHGRYIDRAGNVVIDIGLERGWDFSEGLAAARRKGEALWGYIDTSGKFAITPRFASSVSSFSDGLAKVEVDGKFGYIDRTGSFVIPPQLLDGKDFSDGMARVIVEGPCFDVPDSPCSGLRFLGGDRNAQVACKFTYMDKAGNIITDHRFDAAGDFSEGLAPVSAGGKWGFIDKSGAWVVGPRFEHASPFASGLALFREGSKYGYIDKHGAVKIAARHKHARSFSEGLAVIGDGARRYWYIDKEGKQAIPGKFAEASEFFQGLAHIQLTSRNEDDEDEPLKFAYIDAMGRHVFSYQR